MTKALYGSAQSIRSTNLGTTGLIIKASNGVLKSITGYNARTSVIFIKLYDKATAPTNTDTPFQTLAVPASSAINFNFADGILFNAGISARATTLLIDNDNTAPAASEVLVQFNFN